MANTSCEKCVFSNSLESADKACHFDIPLKINRNIKNVNNYNVIENYKCLYGFSKNQIENNAELMDIDIENLVKEKAKLKYYLIVDLRNADKVFLNKVINEINSLKIKPNYLSLIVSPDDADLVHGFIKHNLSCRKWKMHVLLESATFNDCINIVLDTNLAESESWCVLFVEANFLDKEKIDINKTTNSLQDIFIIKQDNFFGAKYLENDLNLLCLNSRVYKTLTSTVNRNILDSLKTTPEIVLTHYGC